MKLSSMLAACCLALAASGVHAAGMQYDTRITNLAIGVIDLTPNDGAVAGYNFLSDGDTYYSLGLSQPGSPSQSGYHRTPATSPASYTLDGVDSFVSVSSAGRLSDVTAAGALVAAQSSDSYAYSNLNQVVEIELAPNTALSLSGHAFLSLTPPPGTGWYDNGSVRAGVSFRQLDMPCCNTYGGSYGRALDLHSADGLTRIDEDFYLFIGNAGDQAIRVSLEIGVRGESAVSPVPEPSTYGMLLAGLMVVGASARRLRVSTLRSMQKGK